MAEQKEWRELDLTDNQKKIAAHISKEEGITGSALSDKVGIAQSSINHNVKKLEDLDVVSNNAIEHRKTSYYICSDAKVQSNLDLEKLVSKRMKTHLFEVFLALSTFFYLSDQILLPVILGFSLGFLPTFLTTLVQVFDEGVMEISVQVKESAS